MIPEEDLYLHEQRQMQRQKLDIKERQQRINETLRRKEEKILQAKYEQELKEMSECSFTPQIFTKKSKKNRGYNIGGGSVVQK